MNIDVIPLTLSYLDAVWSIEQQAHSYPWAESLVRDVSSRGACHHVMLVDGKVVGYFYAQNIVGEVTLLNIAVDPQQILDPGDTRQDPTQGILSECFAALRFSISIALVCAECFAVK